LKQLTQEDGRKSKTEEIKNGDFHTPSYQQQSGQHQIADMEEMPTLFHKDQGKGGQGKTTHKQSKERNHLESEEKETCQEKGKKAPQ
jgi:hypothetical protein